MTKPQPQKEIQARYQKKLAKEGRLQFNRVVNKKEAKALDKLLAEMRGK